MRENPKIAIVSFRVMKDRVLPSILFGLLVVTPDGRNWAFPEDSNLDQDPLVAGAYEIDPAQLAQSHMPDGSPLYLYREVLNAPQ
jgi:hypothetical protein